MIQIYQELKSVLEDIKNPAMKQTICQWTQITKMEELLVCHIQQNQKNKLKF